MLTRPRFKPHLRLAAVADEGIFVLSGSKQILLRGRLYEAIVPHVDGRSAEEICDALAPNVSAAEVYFTLGELAKKGLLSESGDGLPAGAAAWWSLQQIEPCAASRRLSERRIAVKAWGVDVAPLCDLLCRDGVCIDDHADWSVVVTEHYLRQELQEFNARALADGRPWLLTKPLGVQLWLGPVFRPGLTGCWYCLAERLRSHRAVESYLHGRQSLAEPLVVDGSGTHASAQAAWGLVASAILSWIVRGELPDFEGKIRTFDQIPWQAKSHALVKLPYCAACGQKAAIPTSNGHTVNATSRLAIGKGACTTAAIDGHTREFQPLVLEGQKKTFVRDGGHRVVSPEATLERFSHHVSPITGAVSMLERISPPGDGAMHVYLAGHNLARRHRTLGHLRGDLRNMSAGKGTTDVQAKASGLCEGLERYSGVFRGDELRRRARFHDLGDSGIDLRECLLFSERQYRNRDALNARHSMYNYVPKPFDPEAELEWSPLWSLSRCEVRHLPTAFCYYDYPDPERHQFCIACSNGNAAGNTLEEAILQGTFELVERDSVALWWYNRVRRPGVDIASFGEPYLEELAGSLATYRREMHVIDLTSDLAIPVFAAWSRQLGGTSEQIVLGFGAHLDPRIALLRAITEMSQMLSHLLQAPVDGPRGEEITDADTLQWLKTATADNQPYLRPADGVSFRTAADYAASLSDDVTEDVRECQRRIEARGLEMLVLDQSRPEIGLPVAKVVVPGLRHFWARFAPGRLYDVPVRLGWLPQPLTEDELNPIPMFL